MADQRAAVNRPARDRGHHDTTATTQPVQTVDLADQLTGLRAALAAGQRPPAGALLGLPELPGDVWADIAGAAAVAGVPPRTITGWLSRGGPKHCPFPAPHRFLYRLYWPLQTLQTWRQAYDDAHAPTSSG